MIMISSSVLFVSLDNVEPSIVVTCDSASIQLFQEYRWRWIHNKMITECTGSIVYYDQLMTTSSIAPKNKSKDVFDMRLANISTVPRKNTCNRIRDIDPDTIALQLNRGLEVIVDRLMYAQIKDYYWIYCEIKQVKSINKFVRADIMDADGKKIKSLQLDRWLMAVEDQTVLVKHLNRNILDCRMSNMTLYFRKKALGIVKKMSNNL